jgi:hypothetical protein
LIRKEPLPGNPATVSLRELTTLRLVLLTAPNLVRSRLDRTFCESGLAPQIAAEADVMSTALLAVEAGVGGAIFAQGRLFRRARPRQPVCYADRSGDRVDDIGWLAGEPLTPAASAVRDLLIEFVEQQYLVSLPLGAQRIAASAPKATGDGSLLNRRANANPSTRVNARNVWSVGNSVAAQRGAGHHLRLAGQGQDADFPIGRCQTSMSAGFVARAEKTLPQKARADRLGSSRRGVS